MINKNLNHILLCLIFIIVIMIFLNKYIIHINENFKNYKSSNYNVPYNIFFYWDNLENNSIIYYFIKHIKQQFNNTQWKVFFITKSNVHKYVDSNFIQKFGKLNAVRFSDFLRLKLLYDYGGLWIDVSTIIIKPSFIDKFRTKIMKYKCDVLLFEFKTHTKNKMFPYLENWFIMAPKHSIFIKDLYDYFEKSYDMGFYEFKKNILIHSGLDLSNTIKYGKSTYHMQHALIHYMLLKNRNKYNICIEDADQSMFKAQNHVSWNHEELIKYIINNQDWNNYYAIKLTGNSRKAINNSNRNNFIKLLNTI